MSVNPRIIQDPSFPTVVENLRILDGQSWKANQLLFTDAAGLLKACASEADDGTGGVKYLAMEDQADPGNSTTKAPVVRLTEGMRLEMYVLTGTVSSANLKLRYGLDVASNLCTVKLADTSNLAFEVIDLGFERNPMEFTSGDDPGVVWVRVLPAALEAAGA